MSSFSFGFENYVSMLSDRIVDNLEDFAKPPLAIGIFGQWGSGKSTLLNEIYTNLNGKKIKTTASDMERQVVPVLFNAWRFEKEENLIISLLKTIYYSIRSEAVRYESDISQNINIGSDILRDLIDSMEIATPGYVQIGKDINRGIGEYVEYVCSRERYEAKYFSIHSELSRFAEYLSVVFLIDDLDRCLPDNVLKTLESIKLFLDISGFAFVLAVDDDVVERGILHKYKDYGNFDNLTNLITGSEYL
ncbi:MAG TPA: P-loop NTPase fold protein, partial [Campylobacterales bacterium]|nr:P-loop NTPase fold protein [Campylobacterales bacterium]